MRVSRVLFKNKHTKPTGPSTQGVSVDGPVDLVCLFQNARAVHVWSESPNSRPQVRVSMKDTVTEVLTWLLPSFSIAPAVPA